jgi:hypothetical protein
MVFASVDPAIKEKVIAAYLAGHGRNQITRELHDQKIKVSHGSISNIINAYKRQHEQKQWKSDVSTNTNVPLNNIGSPSSMANGNGLASVTPIQEIDFAANSNLILI